MSDDVFPSLMGAQEQVKRYWTGAIELCCPIPITSHV